MGDHKGETAKSLLACKAVSAPTLRLCLRVGAEVPHERHSNVTP